MTCWLKAWMPGPCDGPIDRCHLIPKQRLKRECPAVDVWAPAWWVNGCRHHHANFDNWVTRIPRSAVPAVTEKAAVDAGIVWSLDRDYGPREVAA